MSEFMFGGTAAENQEDYLGLMSQFARDLHLAFLSKGFTEDQAFALTHLALAQAFSRVDL